MMGRIKSKRAMYNTEGLTITKELFEDEFEDNEGEIYYETKEYTHITKSRRSLCINIYDDAILDDLDWGDVFVAELFDSASDTDYTINNLSKSWSLVHEFVDELWGDNES
jgi:hypothetical protein